MRNSSRCPAWAGRFSGLALYAVAVLAAGCAGYDHARDAQKVAGRPVSLRSEEGADRLDRESRYDSAVRQFVGTHGTPDILYVADRSRLYLYYLKKDMVAAFQRGYLPPAEVTKVEPIPGSLLTLLPRAEMDRILARRKGRAATVARAAPKKRPARRPRAVPAAPSPGNAGVTLNQFDVAAVVERLRRPMSAADAGVGDWRRHALADGTEGRSGRTGSTRYVVLPGEVSVMAAMPRGRTRAPGGLRVGYVRVNNAIFGARADEVSRSVEVLISRVAADPSGRTHESRRILGRVVTITRLLNEELLIYTVRAG